MNTVLPTLRYRNAEKAVSFLIEAFGFSEHLLARNDDGEVVHAQLSFGDCMVMLGPAGESDFDQLQNVPPAGGPVTQSAYVVVTGADTHHDRAPAAGARIAEPLQNPAYGGRFYSCFDLENHLWNFGTYDPWAS